MGWEACPEGCSCIVVTESENIACFEMQETCCIKTGKDCWLLVNLRSLLFNSLIGILSISQTVGSEIFTQL